MRVVGKSAMNPPRCLFLWTITLLLATPCAALSFQLAPAQQRCVAEDIPAGGMLTGDWEFAAAENSSSTELIEIFFERLSVFRKEGHVDGHFAVTAKIGGLHRVCLSNNASEARGVTLNIKTALAVDHDTVAKKEHVEAIEGELDRMRKMAVHVYEEMLFMRRRADQQHATNASTRGRLLWVEVVMMFSVLLMGLWQIRYLRNCAPAASLPMASLPPSVARSSTCVLPAADAWVASDAWSTLLVRPTADFKVKKLI